MWKKEIYQQIDINALEQHMSSSSFLQRILAQRRFEELVPPSIKPSPKLDLSFVQETSEPFEIILEIPKDTLASIISPEMLKTFMQLKFILTDFKKDMPTDILNILACSILQGLVDKSFASTTLNFDLVARGEFEQLINNYSSHQNFHQTLTEVFSPPTQTHILHYDWTPVHQNITNIEHYIKEDKRHILYVEGHVKNQIVWIQKAKHHQEQYQWNINHHCQWGSHSNTEKNLKELESVWNSLPQIIQKEFKAYSDQHEPIAYIVDQKLQLDTTYFQYQQIIIPQILSKNEKIYTTQQILDKLLIIFSNFYSLHQMSQVQDFISKLENCVSFNFAHSVELTPSVTWNSTDQETVDILFELTPSQEKHVLQQLLHDASAFRKKLTVNTYQSWAQHIINRGVCLKKTDGEINMTYVPHKAHQGMIEPEHHYFEVDWEKFLIQVEESFLDTMAQQRRNIDNLILLKFEPRRGGSSFQKIICLKDAPQGHPAINPLTKTFDNQEDTIKTDKGTYQIASQEETYNYIETLPHLDSILESRKNSSLKSEVRQGNDIFVEVSRAVQLYCKIYKQYHKNIHNKQYGQVKIEKEHFEMLCQEQALEYAKQQFLHHLKITDCAFELPFNQTTVLYYKQTDSNHIQEAPNSEKGLFVLNCPSIKKGLEYLSQHNIVHQIISEIPQHITQNPQILPNEKSWECLQKNITLPNNHHIFHSITSQSEIASMQHILHHGGLLSIKERRNIGLLTKSLSPLGDIASNLDHGIATNINTVPIYPSKIILLLDPKLICSRNVWFASYDYGAGANRANQYNAYAQKLGLKNYQSSPTYEARQRHLTLLQFKNNSNEMYVTHGVGIEYIAQVLVHTSLQEEWQSNQLIQQYKLPVFFYQNNQELKDYLWSFKSTI